MKAMKARRRRIAVAAGVVAGITVPAAVAVAQDIRVEVTGSNIKRVEGEGALPVQVITRDELVKSGVTSAVELMNIVSAANSAGAVTIGNVIGATTFSNQTASLRGLSGSFTLVLVNGKRLGTFSGAINGAEGVNLTAIPFSAIERVEVLKDGASAIYGSDAIGGVINFITRKDFTGAEVAVRADIPTRSGGGEQYTAAGTVGGGDLAKDRWNAFVSVQYQEQKALEQRDRDFSRTNLVPFFQVPTGTTSGQTFPGFISTGGIGNLTFPDCEPSIAVGTRCRFDPARYPGVEGLPETKQINAFGSATFQINRDWQAYVTGLYSRQRTEFIIQPVPLSDQIATTITPTGAADILLPPTSPFYPHAAAAAAGVDGEPLNVRWRCNPCGNRDTVDTNEAWQIVAGARGTAWKWDFDGSFNYSENRSKEELKGGFPQYTRILPLLNSGTIDLLSANLTDTMVQQLQATNFNGTTFDSKYPGYGVDFKGSTDLYQLPSGPLAVALGFQSKHETLEQNPNPLLATGDVSGYGGNLASIDNSRTAWAVFGEANIPIVKTLEGNVAVRYDHYSDFGSTTNPKLSLRWQPLRNLLLRGSWGKGFLAPTLYQLWNPQIPGLSQPGALDPLRCPVLNDNNPDCNTQYTVTFGGNPDLKPQRATQTTIGGVWEPVDGLSLGADWFYIDLKDLITNGVPIATILDPTLIATYSSLITRAATCPPSEFVANAPCPITAIDQRFVNIGRAKIEGIDFDFRFLKPLGAYGRLRASVTATYYTKYDVQQPDGSFAGFVSNAFQAPATGITPRLKSYAYATWDFGPWSTTLANSYQSSYTDVNLDEEGNPRRVGSMSLWDLQVQYTGFKNTTLTLGAKNVFDTNPPFTNSNLTFQSGYDPSYYDPRARVVYAAVRYAFK
jgi:iron complex outermembrane receptor protein